jgi:hypothetical protein
MRHTSAYLHRIEIPNSDSLLGFSGCRPERSSQVFVRERLIFSTEELDGFAEWGIQTLLINDLLVRKDGELATELRDAVERIEWALREVLPGQRENIKNSARHPQSRELLIRNQRLPFAWSANFCSRALALFGAWRRLKHPIGLME